MAGRLGIRKAAGLLNLDGGEGVALAHELSRTRNSNSSGSSFLSVRVRVRLISFLIPDMISLVYEGPC